MKYKLEKYALEELVKIKYGKNQKKVQDDIDGKYPIYGTGGQIGKSITYLYDKPSVLIGRKGSIGKVKFIDQPFWTIDTLFYTEIDETKVIPKFLYYKMSLIDFNYYNEGTTIPSLRTDTLNRLEFMIPDISIQNKIVSILDKLDCKIKLNNLINENLQTISQLLFKHWFVDFEFPNEKGNPYRFSGGEMVKSELGMIPKGWEVKKMQEIIDVKDGTHASPKTQSIGYPLVTSKHLSSSGIDFASTKLISQEDYDEVNKRSKVNTGDILITMIGTVGKIYKIDERDTSFAIKNVGLFKTSANRRITDYIYLYLNSNNMKQYIIERLAGSTQQYISLTELRKIPVVIPDNTLETFNDLIKGISGKITEVKEENKSLSNLRDTLLPKLMNGEIDVSNIAINE